MKNFWKKIFFGRRTRSSSSDSGSPAEQTIEKKTSEVCEEQKSDIMCSNKNCYLIQDYIGEGSFGKVAKCVNLDTSQKVALKILKTEDKKVTEREIKMLEVVSVLDPVKKNIVQFLEKFVSKGQTCLAFEMLDMSLLQLLMNRFLKPLSLREIRPIAQQLLTAFDALKDIGVIHADLKPDNIMLVNHVNEPFRVKLIDFGLSFTTSEMSRRRKVQPMGFRAPEVTLGLPISEAIDMWSLGCVLAFLYVSNAPFTIQCEYQMMRDIVKILGQPADHLLDAGRNTHTFFKENKYLDNPKWWLKTPREYQLDTGIAPKSSMTSFASLDDLVTLDPDMEEPIEVEDRRAFVSLLKFLLQTDPEKRITPEKALKHPFVTLAHLEDEKDTSLYVEDSFDKMLVCPMDGKEEELPPDNEADKETNGEAASATPATNGSGSAPHSCEDITIVIHWSDGAAAAEVVEAACSAEEESAVCQGAASPAEETQTPDMSAVEGPPAKVKKSRLKRIRKFFGRAIRTLLGKKKTE